VVGLPARGAHDEVLDAGLLPVAADRDHDGVADLAVVRQHPRPGTRRVTGSHVELWYGRSQGGPHNGPDSNGGGGGGRGGVRPRGPRPLLPTGTKPLP